MFKKAVIITCALAANVFATDYLLYGVNVNDSSTYYDYNKSSTDSADDEFCWAFAASNILQYWQDSQDSSYIADNDIPNGSYATDDDSNYGYILLEFLDAYKDDDIYGGLESWGFNWWLKDVAGTTLFDGYTYTYPDGGGYWSDIYSTNDVVATEINVTGFTDSSEFIDTIANAVVANYGMTLGIYTSGGGAHAITLWGYSIEDETYSLWVTDSDDKYDGIVEYEIYWNEEDQLWYFTDYLTDYDWYIGDITIFYETSSMLVPEPSTATLSFLALAALLARRKRRTA